MKITPINTIKNLVRITALTSTIALCAKSGINGTFKLDGPVNDAFIHNKVQPEGTLSKYVLLNSPYPFLTINGETKCAKFVVDLSQNVLYFSVF